MLTLHSHFVRVLSSHSRECLFTVLLVASLPAYAHTLPTGTTTVFHLNRVVWREKVTALANQSAPESEWAAVYIINVRQRFEMIGVNAPPNAACVVEFHPVRDGAAQQFVGNNVRLPGTVPIISVAVTFFADIAQPEPARFGCVDLFPKQGNVIPGRFSPRFGNSRFRIHPMPIESGMKREIRDSTARIARPIGKALGLAKSSKQSRDTHTSPPRDSQKVMEGSHVWSAWCSARENLSPQLLYIGAAA
jgi:hypothetical protein